MLALQYFITIEGLPSCHEDGIVGLSLDAKKQVSAGCLLDLEFKPTAEKEMGLERPWTSC